MNINSANNFRHQRLPSSDRFLDIFTPTKQSAAAAAAISDELSESEIFWTVTESTRESPCLLARRKLGFWLPEKPGILVAMAEDGSRLRMIPKPHANSHRVASESASSWRFQNSAPMKVPPAALNSRSFSELDESCDDEEEEEEEMLPPHEIVAMKLKMTSSVLEGVGRTLKGRDLRQVRDAVWRQSGFID